MAKEDYTTYTETDPANRFQNITANAFDVVGLLRNDNAWIFDDKGVGNIGDISPGIIFEGQADTSVPASTIGVFGISNTIDDIQAHASGNLASYWVSFNVSGGGADTIFAQTHGPGPTTDTDLMAYTTGNRRFFTVTRSGTTLIIKVYTDLARTNLEDTLTLVGLNTTFRYLYAVNALNTGQNNAISGDIANLEILAAPSVAGAGGSYFVELNASQVW